MRDSDVPVKTNEGRDEIQHRTRKLPTVLRSILLIVDGDRSARHLRDLIASLHGPGDALEQLETMGLIASSAAVAATQLAHSPTPAALPAAVNGAAPADTAERYRTLYTLMSETVREHLGLRGYFLQLKIERCGNSEELAELLPDLSAALGKVRKDDIAAEIEARFATGS
ncbi:MULTISPECIES: hypothetical protein [Lysobacter]|uniref:Uncharacterized protein n=1 Tax=Lysobacter gummosus TaxID=262324 RepID=A0ABY3XGV5_9GAMM|nr:MULTISPECIES: hypothetical protein [Lysobacter]ALN90312.1 hypothetical protein LG3211_1336 [Lysobacter gummosus]UJB17886.1 hypothetical protein L1A79_16155 [Lysobacter capsici]UJQ28391.1 hypothetical protein L2D09_23730 [Lysobacter gummosus]UNP30852.1 hypothetical protein MOV92_06255 [Lysobacter gummosus]